MRTALLLLCCACLVAGPARAGAAPLPHGGQYRGPSDVKPQPSSGAAAPGGGSGGSTQSGGTGAGSGPSTGGATGGPTTGGAAAAAGPKVRGGALGDDLGRWEYWWEFGKDPWLRLREAVLDAGGGKPEDTPFRPRLSLPLRDIARPSDADRDAVASTLATMLRATDDRDIASGCLVALAKIGRDGRDFTVRESLVPFLQSGNQELRETAALALGIAGRLDRETVELLGDLVRDAAAGRAASGGSAVNERTRAFAAFGSGLLLQRAREPAVALRLLAPLHDVLAAPAAHGRDVKVAAIEALGLLPPEWDTPAGRSLRSSSVAALGSYYVLELGAGEELVQAHVPPVIARLTVHDPALQAEWRERFADDLAAGLIDAGASARPSKVNPHVAQSCALALGDMCAAWQAAGDPAAAVGELLVDVYRRHRDHQTRSFAALALARIGGASPREFLLRELTTAKKALEQPWIAVALGVLEARRRRGGAADGVEPPVDRDVAAALVEALRSARTPGTTAALAIALGLVGVPESGDELRKVLVAQTQQDDVAGYAALALGMLRDRRAEADLRALRRDSVRRPFVMMQCTRALGLLGDVDVVDELNAELAAPQHTLARLAAVAAALGQIGDRRSIPPLLTMLGDRQLTPLTRAFAAVALGSVCDKDLLPWNAAYASSTNYRAATDTLTDGQSGILDIL